MEEYKLRCEISQGLFSEVAKEDIFPILLFIGSDKLTGDALAPICGSMLKKMNTKCFIYGSVENPVTATNLIATVDFIKRVHAGCKIIAIDASVGKQEDIGKIKFIGGGISPGRGVGKNFQSVGDMAIAGIVACRNSQTNNISSVRLFHVVEMAKEIANEIYLCCRSFEKIPKQNFEKSDLAGVYA